MTKESKEREPKEETLVSNIYAPDYTSGEDSPQPTFAIVRYSFIKTAPTK